ncbi:MAG: SAM-dependent methyltransferase [Deltaproteobacteria bacterium]|nr:SAM-dependent methyltransferase [Deltaproteobacteria bacterium]
MTLQATIESIGHIITPYKTISDCPRNINPEGPLCKIVIKDGLRDGLLGLNVGQKILILYWFEQVERTLLRQHSRRSGELKGIFALRTPSRCNPIGAAVLPIEQIEDGVIFVRGLDCLDGTPLIDIKPAMSGE